MRRYLVIALSALLAGALVVGCGKKKADPAAAGASAGAGMTTKKAAASGASAGGAPTSAKAPDDAALPVRTK
jgi:hypothetical protein